MSLSLNPSGQFGPNLKKFLQSIPEVSHSQEWDGEMDVPTYVHTKGPHENSISAPPWCRFIAWIINLQVKIYSETNLASPFEGWQGRAIGISSFHLLRWLGGHLWSTNEQEVGDDGGGGGGGEASLTTTWLLKGKRENRARLEKWRQLRKRGCARQTLPTVELKCYCKVTCKVSARQTLTPTHGLASSRTVHFFVSGQGCNTAAWTEESKQSPVSLVAYLTTNSCPLTKSVIHMVGKSCKLDQRSA